MYSAQGRHMLGGIEHFRLNAVHKATENRRPRILNDEENGNGNAKTHDRIEEWDAQGRSGNATENGKACEARF